MEFLFKAGVMLWFVQLTTEKCRKRACKPYFPVLALELMMMMMMMTGLSLSFESPVVLFFTPIANLLLCR